MKRRRGLNEGVGSTGVNGDVTRRKAAPAVDILYDDGSIICAMKRKEF